MDSERRRAIAAGLALLVLGGAAGASLERPRIAVLALMLAAICLGILAANLGRLARRAASHAVEASPLRADQQALLDQALAVETRLEHAPVAVLRIEAHGLAACNVNARRLLSPGGVSNPAALHAQLEALAVGARTLVHYESERGDERALAAVTSYLLGGQAERIAMLMPVESELEAEALQAWRQLVQVLTHEIMNSLTPVASLSRTASEVLADVEDRLPQGEAHDLGVALDAIGRRADSMVAFVGSYRSLSNLPEARPERIAVQSLFERVQALAGSHVQFEVQPPSLDVVVDGGQLEQALIALLKNADEATQGMAAPEIRVSARLVRGGRLRIEVADNGPGVPDDLTSAIFTPFFTTKKQGSGIGLAMVRHLVHANGGTVRYARGMSAGARFVITF